jgi:hypothetical protein
LYDPDVEDTNMQRWITWHCKFKDGRPYRITNTGRLRKAPAPRLEATKKNAIDELKDISTSDSDTDLYPGNVISYPLLVFWTVVIGFGLKSRTQRDVYPLGHVDYDLIDRNGTNMQSYVSIDMDISADKISVAHFAILATSVREYWALLLTWEDAVAERQGIVTLDKDALSVCLDPGPRWWRPIVRG